MSYQDDRTAAEVTEISAESSQIAQAVKQDFNFLGMFVAPEEFVLNFPPFYLTIFAILTTFKNKLERFAISIPRYERVISELACLQGELRTSRGARASTLKRVK